MNDHATISQQIADVLGDACGSYELLMGRNICDAIGVEPTHRGLVVAAPHLTAGAVEWLRRAAESSDRDSDHAAEVLAVFKL